MTFDEYWAANWTENTMPPIFNIAMREIALKAWNSATLNERERCAMEHAQPIVDSDIDQNLAAK